MPRRLGRDTFSPMMQGRWSDCTPWENGKGYDSFSTSLRVRVFWCGEAPSRFESQLSISLRMRLPILRRVARYESRFRVFLRGYFSSPCVIPASESLKKSRCIFFLLFSAHPMLSRQRMSEPAWDFSLCTTSSRAMAAAYPAFLRGEKERRV